MKRILIVLTLVLVGAACGVPTEDTAQVISQEELPEALQNAPSTTTTAAIPNATEEFTYYLLQRRAEQDAPFVVAVTRSVEIGQSMTERLQPMFSDDFVSADEEAEELFNRVPVFDLAGVMSNESGVATVQLEIESPGELRADTLRDVAAQVVFTLTELEEVSAILIEVNGALLPIPSEGGDVTESVDREDFPRFQREFVFPETPEEPTSGPTTTVSS